MSRFFEEPECAVELGLGVGSGDYSLPPNQHDLGAIGRYMEEHNKEFSDLTKEEVEMFRFK